MQPAPGEAAKIQQALLSYSEDAEEQVRRALAHKPSADHYDFKLYQQILRSVPGYGCRVWREDAFVKYTESLMSYYEFKTQSRHTDISQMAGDLSDYERTMVQIDTDLQTRHYNLMDVWSLIKLLAKQFLASQRPNITAVLQYQLNVGRKVSEHKSELEVTIA